jgi:hypothetical protein
MKERAIDLHKWLSVLSVVILVAGLASALMIYRTAGEDSSYVLGYEEGDGSDRAIAPQDSKKYLRDLELYGGKMNVLSTELSQWFSGLWRGESLGLTVAVITILLSFGVLYAASRMPPRSGTGTKEKDRRL